MLSHHRLTLMSRSMAAITLVLIIAMLVGNTTYWLLPQLITEKGIFTLSLSGKLISSLNPDLVNFSLGKKLGGIFLSSLPLLILANGLLSLRALFENYSHGEYFSSASTTHLRKLSQAIGLWAVTNFLCEPLLSIWLTWEQPVGERLMSISIDSSSIIAVFLSACIAIVAHILQHGGELDAENQKFV